MYLLLFLLLIPTSITASDQKNGHPLVTAHGHSLSLPELSRLQEEASDDEYYSRRPKPTEKTALLGNSEYSSTERDGAIIAGVSAGCMCTVFAAFYCCFGIPLPT